MTHRKTERTTPQHSCSSPRRLHKWQVGRCRSLLPPSPLAPAARAQHLPGDWQFSSVGRRQIQRQHRGGEERKGERKRSSRSVCELRMWQTRPNRCCEDEEEEDAAARSESSQPLETFFQEVGEDSAPRRERPSQTEERTETEGGSGLCSALFARLLSAAARIFEL